MDLRSCQWRAPCSPPFSAEQRISIKVIRVITDRQHPRPYDADGNTYRYDYRGADNYVRDHARPGDIIFPGIPHVFRFYTGLPGDYFLDTILASKVPYNQSLGRAWFRGQIRWAAGGTEPEGVRRSSGSGAADLGYLCAFCVFSRNTAALMF